MVATAKYEIIEKYPDYLYMKNGKNKYEAWNDYLKDTINAPRESLSILRGQS